MIKFEEAVVSDPRHWLPGVAQPDSPPRTGGSPGRSVSAPSGSSDLEMVAPFDAGTMNWLHSVVFMNEPKFLELCGQEMRAKPEPPEIEVFDRACSTPQSTI